MGAVGPCTHLLGRHLGSAQAQQDGPGTPPPQPFAPTRASLCPSSCPQRAALGMGTGEGEELSPSAPDPRP